jgi:hypothetical protein
MRRILIGSAATALALVATALTASGDGSKREPVVAAGTYAGENMCVRCHFKHTRLWKATAHVKAVEILPAKYRNDATCVTCHATGAGQQGGYVSVEKTPKLASVGCEACHGPGAEHASYAKANEEKLDQDEVVKHLHAFFTSDVRLSCTKCHVAESHHEHPEYEGMPGKAAKGKDADDDDGKDAGGPKPPAATPTPAKGK